MARTESSNRPWLWIGGAILAAGLLVLGGFWVYAIVRADDVPLLIKAALLALPVGLAVFLAAALRDRIIQKKQENFLEVDN
ncbi:MAG: hypothetical protein OXE05_04360 [Chloroflexi bacterium]|nr:hypothetical protein [Chloroflexota bacterium]